MAVLWVRALTGHGLVALCPSGGDCGSPRVLALAGDVAGVFGLLLVRGVDGGIRGGVPGWTRWAWGPRLGGVERGTAFYGC